MLEIVQRMEELGPGPRWQRSWLSCGRSWGFVSPVPDATLEKGIRMHLAVMQKVQMRGFEAVSLVDVDGVKKLLHFPPALPLLLLADKGGVASIPENDALGSVTQLIVRYLTGQVAAYLEIYEFMTDRLLLGVPDYVPSEVVEGHVRVLPWPGFGGLKDGILNISKVRTGRMTICRLAARGDRYTMHIATGEAVGAALLGRGGLGAAGAATTQRRIYHRWPDRNIRAERAEPTLHHHLRRPARHAGRPVPAARDRGCAELKFLLSRCPATIRHRQGGALPAGVTRSNLFGSRLGPGRLLLGFVRGGWVSSSGCSSFASASSGCSLHTPPASSPRAQPQSQMLAGVARAGFSALIPAHQLILGHVLAAQAERQGRRQCHAGQDQAESHVD